MIGVEIDGRLGNQLFQYAFALSTARRLRTHFFLYNYHHRLLINEYFDLNSFNFYFNQIQNKIYKAYKNKWDKVELDNERAPVEQLKKVTNRIVLKGYFQSEEYFLDIMDEISNEFQVRNKYQRLYNNLIIDYSGCEETVIHFRGGDYLRSNYLLPKNYYAKCLGLLDERDKEILIVTDDPVAAKDAFPEERFRVLPKSEPIVDFQILMKAKNVIISNSSFAWWACYLNTQSDKRIMAPKNWLGYNNGKEYPACIMTKKFIWI